MLKDISIHSLNRPIWMGFDGLKHIEYSMETYYYDQPEQPNTHTNSVYQIKAKFARKVPLPSAAFQFTLYKIFYTLFAAW